MVRGRVHCRTGILLLALPLFILSQSQWQRGLRPGFVAACLLVLRVRISPESCMSLVGVVCCQVEVSASTDHSSREVLKNVMCLKVIVKPR
jgi:hypothetical protein